MDFNRLFSSFFDELCNRTGVLTEDNVRYILFAKMLEQDNILNHYCLELPYRGGANNPLEHCDFRPLVTSKGELNQELDLFYTDEITNYAIEIKFHRPSETTTGLPNKAGELFNDIKRLELINLNGFKKFFVYITDDEMNNYFNSNRGMTNKFFHKFLASYYSGGVGDFIDNSSLNNATATNNDGSKTFLKCASRSFFRVFNSATIQCNAMMIFKDDRLCNSPNVNRGNRGNLHIRVHEIL